MNGTDMFLPHLKTKPQPATEPEQPAPVQRMPATRPERKPAALCLKFKTKLQATEYSDGTTKREFYNVPAFTRNHCENLQAFRTSKRFGGYANSDLFPAILRRAVNALGFGSRLYLDSIPDNVTVDNRGFLAVVTIALSDE